MKTPNLPLRCITAGQAVPDSAITRVLRAIADEAEPMTVQQLAAALGMRELCCTNHVSRLRMHGDVAAVDRARPYRWRATPCGLSRLDGGFERRAVHDATTDESLTTVQAALSSRPPLQQVWGPHG